MMTYKSTNIGLAPKFEILPTLAADQILTYWRNCYDDLQDFFGLCFGAI